MQIIGGLIKRLLFLSDYHIQTLSAQTETCPLQPDPIFRRQGLMKQTYVQCIFFPDGDWMVGCVMMLLFLVVIVTVVYYSRFLFYSRQRPGGFLTRSYLCFIVLPPLLVSSFPGFIS